MARQEVLSCRWETTTDKTKLYLRLSPAAWRVLDNDLVSYGGSSSGRKEKTNYSQMIGTILTNFAEDAESSVSFYCDEHYPGREDMKEIVIRHAQERLNRVPRKQPKNVMDASEKKRCYISVGSAIDDFLDSTVACLESHTTLPGTFEKDGEPLPEERYLYKDFSAYLRALLEEYAELPYNQRERILFRDAYRAIEDGVYRCEKKSSSCLVYFKTRDGRPYCLQPYTTPFLSDPLLPYNYLVGFSHSGDEKSFLGTNSFRLSSIDPRTVVVRPAPDVTVEMQKEAAAKIERAIRIYGVPYLSAAYHPENAWITAEVEFTPQGVFDLQRTFVNRPRCERKSPGGASETALPGSEVWLLTGYEWKLELYLLPFGADARVLGSWRVKNEFDDYQRQDADYGPDVSATDLKNKMAARHYQAFQQYYNIPPENIGLPREFFDALLDIFPLPRDGDPIDEYQERLDGFLKMFVSLPKPPKREDFTSEEDYMNAAKESMKTIVAKLFQQTRPFSELALTEDQVKECIRDEFIDEMLLDDDDDDDTDEE